MKIKRKEIVAFEAKDDYVVETIVENEYRGFGYTKKGMELNILCLVLKKNILTI